MPMDLRSCASCGKTNTYLKWGVCTGNCWAEKFPDEAETRKKIETTIAQKVDGRALPRAHVIDFGLLDGVVLEVPVRRHIQRRHIFLRISPIKNPMKYIIVLAVGHSQGPT
jgi:hypothetical protein